MSSETIVGEKEETSALHRVFIDENERKVIACRVSAIPYNVWWQGRQRPETQSEEASFVSFEFTAPVQVRVIAEKIFKSALVRPLSAGIRVESSGQEICFTVNCPGQYVLETDDDHNALHIFANPPRDFSEYGSPALFFGAGVHRVGKIVLKSGDRVYLDKDAVVYGSFYAKDASDIRIYGYGILDGGWEERKSMHCYEDYTNGCVKFYGCSDISVEGVVLRNSAIWVVNLFDCEDIALQNVKIVGHYRYNTDGVDIVNSRRVRIENCFIRSFDDAITLKGILQYKEKCVEDILVENTVCWCGWGRTLEIGLETVAPAYRRICFRNCDLIHNSAAALDIQAGDYAEISDLTFEDIRVEYQPYTLPEIIDNPPGKPYSGYGKRHVPLLFNAENPEYFINDENYRKYDEELKKTRVGKTGALKGCKLIRVSAVGDAGGDTPALRVQFSGEFRTEAILVKDLSVFGKKVYSAGDCRTEGEDAGLLRFE